MKRRLAIAKRKNTISIGRNPSLDSIFAPTMDIPQVMVDIMGNAKIYFTTIAI
jgi:hypothetical protein